jgi:hypothetical protein
MEKVECETFLRAGDHGTARLFREQNTRVTDAAATYKLVCTPHMLMHIKQTIDVSDGSAENWNRESSI